MKKRYWALIGLVIIAGAGGLAMTQIDNSIDVETGKVSRQAMSETISEDGQTRVAKRYMVAAPISGQLLGVTVETGDFVDKGQLLGRVFPPPQRPHDMLTAQAQVNVAEAQRDQAQARLEEARSEAEQARQKADRSAQLSQSSSVSRVSVEQDEMAAQLAERQVSVAEANLKAAGASVDAAKAAVVAVDPGDAPNQALDITAPAAGQVLKLMQSSEIVVQAGTPILEIGDVSHLQVVIDVLSDDAVKIQAGDPVTISDWGGNGTLDGVVQRVEPDAFSEVSALGVSEQRVNVIADLPDAPAGLGAGYRVTAAIQIWQADNVLAVPTDALFQKQGGWHVFTVSDGTAHDTAIKIGHRSTEMAEVTEGLLEGDDVILFPSDQISDGAKVK